MRKPSGSVATHMYLRTLSRLIVVSLVVVVGGLLVLRQHLSASGGPARSSVPTLTAGTVLDGQAAPMFTLRDQTGATFSPSRLAGHPVVLTFLDVTSPADEQAAARDLNGMRQSLGGKAADVAWVAVSVNPSATAADAQAFLAQSGVRVPLHVLLGTQAQLAPVWQAYSISVIAPTAAGGAIQHTNVTYLLDTHGHERELLDSSYDPAKAAHDVTQLLGTGQ